MKSSIVVPRGPAIAIAALLLLSLAAATLTRVTGVGMADTAPAAAVQVREFQFQDRPDGGVAILDGSGRAVSAVAPGENGFLRSTMRGMVRERKRRGVGPERPFQLVGHADGRFTLEDPATGRTVDLGSFGPTNAAFFVRLMATPSAAS